MRQLTQYTSSPLSAPWADRLGAEARQVSVHGQQHARPTAHPHESPTYHGLRQRRVRHDERTGSDAPDQQWQRQQQEHNSRVCCTVGGSKGGLPCRREAGSTVSCESPTAVESSLVSGSPRGPWDGPDAPSRLSVVVVAAWLAWRGLLVARIGRHPRPSRFRRRGGREA